MFRAERKERSFTKTLQVAESLIAKIRNNGKLAALKNGLNQRFLLRVVSAMVVYSRHHGVARIVVVNEV